MMPLSPAVTVLIDTYNHERFIEQAIASVLAQDFPAAEFEVVVVDDGSTDRTPEIVAKFGSRVRMIRKPNGGQASAFNAGIPEARGEIIAFLDADDWWSPEKLSRVVEYFEAHPGAGVLGHGIYQADGVTGRTIETQPPEAREMSFATEEGAQFFRRMMCFFGTSRLAMRREIAQRALPIPESIVIEADEFLCIAGIAHSSAAVLQEALTYYRLHEDNHYQLRDGDARKLRRMQSSLETIAREIAPRLREAEISPSAIEILIGPIANAAKRIRLQTEGGMSWETFAAERAEKRYAYAGGSVAYRVFEAITLAMTLVLPPKTYYRLRHWYGASGIRRWRGFLGEPVSAAAIANRPVNAAVAAGSEVRGAARA